MVYLEEPDPIREALERARIVLHHGSILTTEEVLAAGRPQVVAPFYLEHLFPVRALAALGVARVVRPSFSVAEVADTLASAVSDAGLADRARAWAEGFGERRRRRPTSPIGCSGAWSPTEGCA